MLRTFRNKFIGSKAFYGAVIALIIPMIVQQGITQFVNLLDNVMVGRLGTAPMSGVAIVNQIIFIFNLTIFGGLSGASIFGAQFYGKGDHEGLRYTFRFRILFSLGILVIGVAAFLLFGDQLITLYLNEEASSAADIAATLACAKEYMVISLWGLLPFVIVQSFSSTLRDVGETVRPMTASVISILVNLVLNYLLIFGSFGFPKMGVAGAALATVIARYLEMAYLVWASYRNKARFKFLQGAFKSMRIPLSLIKKIAVTGTPLMLNETLWSIGMAAINMCYATRGLTAVAANNISGTVWNLFSIAMMAMGSAIGIMTGQLLGANEIEEAKSTVRKLIFFNVALNLVMGGLIIAAAPLIPHIYNTEEIVRQTATQLLIVSGIFMPVSSYVHGVYFTIRSGGKTFITFLFDCVFTWVITLPLAYLLSHYTQLNVVWMLFFIQLADIIKVIIGTVMLKSGIWANNVVNDNEEKPAASAS